MPKISQLPTLETITTGSIIPVVENSITQKLSVGKLFEFLSGALDETFATETELMLTASGGNVNTSSLVTTSSFNSYTSSNDGKWNTLGGQTGSFITEAETGSFVTNVSMFLSKSAFDTYTGSAANAVSSAINAATSSLSSSNAALDNIQLFTSSFNTFTSSVNSFSASVNGKTGSYATTGSNTFTGTQTLNASFVQGLFGGAGATGVSAHAQGYYTEARGEYSHAEGLTTLASGTCSHAEGTNGTAGGSFSHAEGNYTQANGAYSHAEGNNTQALGVGAHSEGNYTIAKGNYQHVQGQYNITSSAQSAFIIGNGTDFDNRSNLIFASGSQFQITGSLTVNGNQTITGSLNHGLGNTAAGENSHAEGDSTQAIGNFSHAEGLGTIAYGGRSHAEGQDTIASGSYSHTEGNQTIALADHQHVQGQYNITSSVPAAFIVGNGTDDSNRSNLIHAAGNEVQITGSLSVSGSLIVTGSARGNVVPITIVSSTASLDMTSGSYFTLTLANTANTHIRVTSITPGVNATLLITTGTDSSASLSPLLLQPSGSYYTASLGSGKKDVLSLVAFDSTNMYVVSTKAMQ